MKLNPVLARTSDALARQRVLAGLIFGIQFHPLSGQDHYFDVTTVVLYRKMRTTLSDRSSVLDLGTGAAAVLGISLWKHTGCKVIAADINPDVAELARANVALNGAPISVVCSRFFDDIDDEFDTVVFNPPYVPSASGAERSLPEERRSQWDGGPAGTAVVEQYLSELKRLDRPVTTYMGVNHMHVRRESMTAVIGDSPSCTLSDVYRHRALPVDVYTIRSAAS